MPPYRPNASMAQQRLMFAKANRGEVSMADAHGRARASAGEDLPERVEKEAGLNLELHLLKLAEIETPSLPDYASPTPPSYQALPIGGKKPAATKKADFSLARKLADSFMTPPPALGTDKDMAPVQAAAAQITAAANGAEDVAAKQRAATPPVPLPTATKSTSSTNSGDLGAPATTGQGTSKPGKAKTFNAGDFSAKF